MDVTEWLFDLSSAIYGEKVEWFIAGAHACGIGVNQHLLDLYNRAKEQDREACVRAVLLVHSLPSCAAAPTREDELSALVHRYIKRLVNSIYIKLTLGPYVRRITKEELDFILENDFGVAAEWIRNYVFFAFMKDDGMIEYTTAEDRYLQARKAGRPRIKSSKSKAELPLYVQQIGESMHVHFGSCTVVTGCDDEPMVVKCCQICPL